MSIEKGSRSDRHLRAVVGEHGRKQHEATSTDGRESLEWGDLARRDYHLTTSMVLNTMRWPASMGQSLCVVAWCVVEIERGRGGRDVAQLR